MSKPPMNLPPEAAPWGRYIEAQLGTTTRQVEIVGSDVLNAQKSQSSTLDKVNVQGGAIVENQAAIQQTADDILAVATEASIANGRITYSQDDPNTIDESGTGKEVGSIWWQHDGSANIVAQWEWDGTTWNPVTLTHQVISSVDLGTATVGELDGVYIKSRTISSDALLVGDFSNYLNNGDLTQPIADGWEDVTPGFSIQTGTDGAGNPRNYLESTTNPSRLRNTYRLAIQPLDQLLISYQSWHLSGLKGIGLTYFKQDGTLLSTALTGIAVSGSWVSGEQTWQAPAGAYFASLTLDQATAGTSRWAALSLRRMVNGALIVDGSIDGKTITGALLRTAASGARIELDSTNGIRGFNSGGSVLTQLTTGGVLTATGATVSGTLRSAASGQRFELNSTQLRFYTALGALGQMTAYDDGAGAAGLNIDAGLGFFKIGRESLPAGGSSAASINGPFWAKDDIVLGGELMDQSGDVLSPEVFNISYTSGFGAHASIGVEESASMKRAFLDGAITNTATKTMNAGTVYQVGTVPAGFRPPAERIFIVDHNFGATIPARIAVTAAGAINFTPANSVASAGANSLRIGLCISWDLA